MAFCKHLELLRLLEMEIIGYARVSSAGQSLDVQLDKLTKAGCGKVYQEKRSGRQAENRPELQAALEYVRDGDVLVVSRLDRVARSVLDLAKIADRLKRKNVSLRVLDQGLDTTTSEGKLMFNLLGAFAEFEADIRAERQRDGIALAQQKGTKFGRKKVLTEVQEERLRRMRAEDGFSIEQLAERFSISRSSVYRALHA
ncbi:recombinase family protein [Stenotrophomonas maltophilia]|uniref:recombinase family protein n=3 Tax=Gammaproteobacteria TaxID=1236 RepID=UPI001E51659D|nr:recombinase family protein [Stenotrophomonas maltophilia]